MERRIAAATTTATTFGPPTFKQRTTLSRTILHTTHRSSSIRGTSKEVLTAQILLTWKPRHRIPMEVTLVAVVVTTAAVTTEVTTITASTAMGRNPECMATQATTVGYTTSAKRTADQTRSIVRNGPASTTTTVYVTGILR
ncbi:hypothetical protein RvY_06508-4 [Ramazzottius varieornatus]|nr:hypothetical protein RvY_06508-4 [Ramazzottius varieornatus]